MLRRLLKEKAQVFDRVRVEGGGPRPRFRGMRMADGSPVPIELIMQSHGVSREEAEIIQKRQTR